MSNDSTPRWGSSVFSCEFCNTEGMRWIEVSPGKWKPYDLLNMEIHNCLANDINKLTRDKTLQRLQDIGFEAYIPRTQTWKYAFIASNHKQTIYFLVRKRGIDFKLYNTVRETKIDEEGKLFTDGGEMVRNHYYDSDVHIHKLILDIASRLVTDTPIDEFYTSGHGKSWQEQRAEYYRNNPKAQEAADRNVMKQIYHATSSGDGEDAYLGDGVWISSSGSLDDRGR